MKLDVFEPGLMDYDEALALQKDLRERRIAGTAPDTLILLEHPPVITLGRRADGADVLISRETARARGVKVASIDRGGEVTYHGPGQLVGYFIVHLSATGGSVRRFVENIEEAVILLAAEYGIAAGRHSEHRGVWVGTEKLAALGLSVSRQVTMHGFALNVNTDLAPFSWIVPCGIRGCGVTSMEKTLGRRLPPEEVKERLLGKIIQVFGYDEAGKTKREAAIDG